MKTILLYHIFCLIAVVLDAWYNSLVIKQDSKWHMVQSMFLGFMAVWISVLWLNPDKFYCNNIANFWEYFYIVFIYASWRFVAFNYLLNIFMKWPITYLGTTSWLDKNIRGFVRTCIEFLLIALNIYYTFYFLQ